MIVNVGGTHIDIDSADYLVKATDWSWIGNDAHILKKGDRERTLILVPIF